VGLSLRGQGIKGGVDAILGWGKKIYIIDRLLSIRWEVRGSGWDGMGWSPIDRYESFYSWV
jgi:hypothetical protein